MVPEDPVPIVNSGPIDSPMKSPLSTPSPSRSSVNPIEKSINGGWPILAPSISGKEWFFQRRWWVTFPPNKTIIGTHAQRG